MPNKEKFYTAINMIDEIMDWMMGNSHGYIDEIEEGYNMSCDEAMQTICAVFMEAYDA